MRRIVAATLAAAAAVTACSGDDGGRGADGTATSTTAAEAATATPEATAAPRLAGFDVVAGTEQLTVTNAEPGRRLTVTGPDGVALATGTVDASGALLFRSLPSGVGLTVGDGAERSAPAAPLDRDRHPDPSFYAGQRLATEGLSYVTTRDGTTLSAAVRLPGPAGAGPYPTVVEYSGYTPSDPDAAGFADLFNALGYAYVGVNIRGTGCSGGSYRFFEYSQSLDGYDAIEAVAAQPWVQDHRVGMVGVSYPGISQLFVAQTRPPSLAAITPFSVIADTYRSTLYPGGLLNTGFAVPWAEERMEQARPGGQAWAATRIAGGDATCAANQGLRLQNPDLLAEVRANPYWVDAVATDLAPRLFVDRIAVPTFVAGAWQDEQTGGHFATMLDRFTGTDHLVATLTNGLHTESIGPAVLPRLVAFLDLYVARRTPSLEIARQIAPQLGESIFGTGDVTVPPGEPFAGMTYEQALAAFEAEPPIQVLFEEGAADGHAVGAPLPRFEAGFDAWPVPEAVATGWYLGAGGTLTAGDQPAADDIDADAGAGAGEVRYLALPDAIPATWYHGSPPDIWKVGVTYDWQQSGPGTFASFLSEPLASDTVIVGSGSVDLWMRSNLGDTDVEATISEVRPDGSEVYVQSGWLRASQRALDDGASTELRPVHTHLEADAAPLPADRADLVRVELFPVAHPFRAGSRIRLTVDAPGGNRAEWEFETIAGGEQVTIATGPDHPSRLVLPVVPGIEVPAGLPACGALRGQPCRPYPG